MKRIGSNSMIQCTFSDYYHKSLSFIDADTFSEFFFFFQIYSRGSGDDTLYKAREPHNISATDYRYGEVDGRASTSRHTAQAVIRQHGEGREMK